jgi:hypothetical protein
MAATRRRYFDAEPTMLDLTMVPPNLRGRSAIGVQQPSNGAVDLLGLRRPHSENSISLPCSNPKPDQGDLRDVINEKASGGHAGGFRRFEDIESLSFAAVG